MLTSVSLEHVSKSFRRRSEIRLVSKGAESRSVLKDVTMSAGEGETVCILGKNGAGKTTLTRILSTLILPDHGKVTICGVDARDNPEQARSHIGVMLNAGDGGFHPRLSARRNLQYYAALNLMPRSKVNGRIDDLLKLVGLDDRGADQSQSYSTGMRRRLALARALLNDPPVLLLDEPTLGVDPWTSKHIHELLLGLSSEGRTVFCTTNNVPEAERLGKRVYLLENGEFAPWRGLEAHL